MPHVRLSFGTFFSLCGNKFFFNLLFCQIVGRLNTILCIVLSFDWFTYCHGMFFLDRSTDYTTSRFRFATFTCEQPRRVSIIMCTVFFRWLDIWRSTYYPFCDTYVPEYNMAVPRCIAGWDNAGLALNIRFTAYRRFGCRFTIFHLLHFNNSDFRSLFLIKI